MSVASYVITSVNRINMFNDLCSNLDNVDTKSILLQLNLIQEELKEAFDGVYNLDDEELLDGAVDTFVTSVGLLLKLESAGFKVEEAMKRIDLNNLDKFPKLTDPKLPEIIAKAHESGYTTEKHTGYQVLVIKDKNGKVRKPSTFKSVEIGDCAVAGFLREMKEGV